MKNLITKFAIKLNQFLLEQKIKSIKEEAPIIESPLKAEIKGETDEIDNSEFPIIIEVKLEDGEVLMLKSYDICSDFVSLTLNQMISAGELPEQDLEKIEFDVYVRDSRKDDE